MQATFTTKQTNRRFKGILGEVRNLPSNSDVIRELAELSFALEDTPARAVVVARLTLTRADGTKTIVEVHEDARFVSFYHIFKQQGNKRSTKRHLRMGGRHEGLNLEAIAIAWKMRESKDNPIVDIKIRILQRRIYRKLIAARPDQLGLSRMPALPIYSPVTARS